MKIIILLTLVTLSLCRYSTTEDFFQFLRKYNKTYSPEELPTRFEIFKEAKREVHRLNEEARASGLDTKFGMTKFADMTKEEFQGKMMGYKKTSNDKPHAAKFHIGAPLPAALDWRKTKGVVTPVKNQEQCGSCWAFSATEGVESAWFLAKHKELVLSPQQIVSCDQTDSGCDGGDLPTAFQYVKGAGMETDAVYPYTSGGGDTGTCHYKSQDVVAHISGFQYATTTGNETQMQVAMVTHGPLSICVDASTWQYYQGGVITHSCGDSLDHCVQIVGWNVYTGNIPYWIIRNSWGADWGLQGYLWVERNKDECGVSDEATYVTI